MRKILLVAWREFKHTALTKAFIFGAVLTPIGIVGVLLVLPMLTKTTLPPLQGVLAVIAPSDDIANDIADELTPQRIKDRYQINAELIGAESMRSTVRRVRGINWSTDQLPPVRLEVISLPATADVEAIKDRVRSQEFLALAVIPESTLRTPQARAENVFELYVPRDISPHHTGLIEDAIAEAVVRARVDRSGLDLSDTRRLVIEPSGDVRQLGQLRGETRDAAELKIFIPIAFMMLLWISTFTSGNYLLTSTIEEKSNKVMEVLLSAVSPFELLAGKILGHAVISFIMLLMYSGVGLFVLAVAAKLNLIPPILLLYLFIYFIMAFFMVASIMAGVGSAVSELRDAQSLITPAMLLLMIPLILWFPISNDPNGVLATITSFLPPLTPFVMILRVTTATEPVPTWQIAGSIVVGFCWMVVMIWGSAKIFRIGVLMYGKPPSPLELLRWVRYR